MTFWQKIGNWLDKIFGSKVNPPTDDRPDNISTDPLWIQVAKNEIGQKEVQGGENPRIIEYHSATTLKAKEDEVPWCASFVCWVLAKAGYKTTKSAWAQSYTPYGEKLSAPKYGCVLVFRWDNSRGHVGFCVGFDSEYVYCLGGNQSNAVNIKKFPRRNVHAYRWPIT